MNEEWVEYELGDTAFAITSADTDHPVPVRGALVAFEVADLDAEIARLRNHGIELHRELVETAVWRFFIALDPDGNEILIISGNQRGTWRRPLNSVE